MDSAKPCVYCLGEAHPCGPARKAKGGKYQRKFRCSTCRKSQVKILEPSDPYAGHEPVKPEKKRGRRSKAEIEAAAKGLVALTPELANAKPTAKSLAAHAYQRKLAAHYAPSILPSTFQALKTGVEAGSAQVIKMVLELYELVQTDKRVSVVNVDNRSVNIDARDGGRGSGDAAERRDFEAVARMLEQSREKRLIEGNPLASHTLETVNLTATPEGISK